MGHNHVDKEATIHFQKMVDELRGPPFEHSWGYLANKMGVNLARHIRAMYAQKPPPQVYRKMERFYNSEVQRIRRDVGRYVGRALEEAVDPHARVVNRLMDEKTARDRRTAAEEESRHKADEAAARARVIAQRETEQVAREAAATVNTNGGKLNNRKNLPLYTDRDFVHWTDLLQNKYGYSAPAISELMGRGPSAGEQAIRRGNASKPSKEVLQKNMIYILENGLAPLPLGERAPEFQRRHASELEMEEMRALLLWCKRVKGMTHDDIAPLCGYAPTSAACVSGILNVGQTARVCYLDDLREAVSKMGGNRRDIVAAYRRGEYTDDRERFREAVKGATEPEPQPEPQPDRNPEPMDTVGSTSSHGTADPFSVLTDIRRALLEQAARLDSVKAGLPKAFRGPVDELQEKILAVLDSMEV